MGYGRTRGHGDKGRGDSATRRWAMGEGRWEDKRTFHYWETSPLSPLLKKERGNYTPGIFMNGLISFHSSLFTFHSSFFTIRSSLLKNLTPNPSPEKGEG